MECQVSLHSPCVKELCYNTVVLQPAILRYMFSSMTKANSDFFGMVVTKDKKPQLTLDDIQEEQLHV